MQSLGEEWSVDNKMSVLSLILNASFLVQMVMLLLLIASVMSWVMIFQRRRALKFARVNMKAFEEQFWSGIDLSQLFRQVSAEPNPDNGAENIFRAGIKEFTRLRQQTDADGDAVMEGVQRAMRVAISKEEEKLEAHLSFLASVGSVSPYVGLFGTVWGIMNSFQSIAISRNTSLAIVAPGIAEALFATALGLLAAIPAVVAYNKFNTDSKKYSQKLENFSKRFLTII